MEMLREIETDFEIRRQLMGVVRTIEASLNRRQAILDKAKEKKNNKILKSVAFFRETQDQELALKRELMIQINE
nr:hypothetical protein [Tanacetum cinerariifolium]